MIGANYTTWAPDGQSAISPADTGSETDASPLCFRAYA